MYCMYGSYTEQLMCVCCFKPSLDLELWESSSLRYVNIFSGDSIVVVWSESDTKAIVLSVKAIVLSVTYTDQSLKTQQVHVAFVNAFGTLTYQDGRDRQ